MSQVVLDGSVASNVGTGDSKPSALNEAQSKVTYVLATDFCPWANKYVYWLKEPIGWFVMGLAVSVLVGMHVSPLGWTLAAVIAGIIVVGMMWPWIAVRAAHCELSPAVAEIHEGEECELVFSVRNSLPLPLWGLAVEGYLDREGDESLPTIALACVPPISEADYRLAVNPEMRGQYPIVSPKVACSFPFGIWTAQKTINGFSPLVVFPQVSLIQDEATLSGGRMSEVGDGLRAGSNGETLGVREFRSGDRLRNVHWVHTARTGNLVVCERGAPQQQAIEVLLDTRPLPRSIPSSENREALAWRVRVAASLVTHLHARHIPVTLRLSRKVIHGTAGSSGLRRMLMELADIPIDGVVDGDVQLPSNKSQGVALLVSGDALGSAVHVDYLRAGSSPFSPASSGNQRQVVIDLKRPIAFQLLRFWREVEHARAAA